MTHNKGAGLVMILAVVLCLLLLPLQWLAAMCLAMVFHEGCHYLMIRICGGTVTELRVRPSGILMEVHGLRRWQEVICSLAGPIGGLLLLSTPRWLPRTAICAGAQSLFNLLPVYPLDGGRALRCGAEVFLPPLAAGRLCDIIERGCLLGLFFLGIYGCFCLRLGTFPLLASGLVALRAFRGKIPCKAGAFSLQ